MLDTKKAGNQIALLRKKMKYTQEELAEKLGVTSQAVSKWENGYAMPEVAILFALSEVLDCSIDSIIKPKPHEYQANYNYEFIALPKTPVGDYTGSEWPKSIAYSSLLTALKLFMGLETRMDSQGRQMNDDDEYILQAAISNICFGYSWNPEPINKDCFHIYGLDYELHHKSDYTEDNYISLICDQIGKGLPAIVLPKDYTDTIFAIGFSDNGKILKGLGFLDGDDQKNIKYNFNNLSTYQGWHSVDSSILCVKPIEQTISLETACINALKTGITLLSNDDRMYGTKIKGYGKAIYWIWRELLLEENEKDMDKMPCLYPHAFIHYEAKLRTKQFFERCGNIIAGIDQGLIASAIKQYEEIMNFAGEIAGIANEMDSFKKDELKEKRKSIINMLQRSREMEELALSYLEKAVNKIS